MTHLKVPNGGNKTTLFINKIGTIRGESRCGEERDLSHMVYRGRHFSPSLSGDRYLKLGSKSYRRTDISWNIVQHNALAPRPEGLRSLCFVCACAVGKKIYTCNCNLLQIMALIVQKVDGAIHRINHCPAHQHKQNQLSYLVDSTQSGPVPYEQLGPPGLLFLNQH